MSGDRRAPWWYSGDADDHVPAEPVLAEPEAQDGAQPHGADLEDAVDEDAPDGAGTSSAMDWTALVAGAARMVDWATERVMAPHAEHGDPAEHPECMVCRTVSLIGDPVGLMGGGQWSPADREPAESSVEEDAAEPGTGGRAQSIRWIPIVETSD
jgi:hypothetical protein